MKNYLPISNRELLADKLNSKHFEVNPVSQFLSYYMQILNFACEINLTDKNSTLEKAQLIISYISTIAEGKAITIANYLYVIAFWLHSIGNYNAWEQLEKVNDTESTRNFLNSAKDFLEKKLTSSSSILEIVEQKVLLINCNSITETFNFYHEELKNLRTFSLTESSINLKSLHKVYVFSVYSFLSFNELEKFDNYIDRLFGAIKSFSLEVSILCKIDYAKLLQFKEEEKHRILQFEDEETAKIFNNDALSNLKNEFDANIQAALNEQNSFEQKIDSLREEFISQHPELNFEDLDKAFESYLDTIPVEFFASKYDTVKIEREYQKKKRKLLEKQVNDAKQLEEKLSLNCMLRGDIELNFSLHTAITEYALVSLAKRGEIPYPATSEERGIMLSNISNEVAISEFLKLEIDLSDAELSYLESAK